jgi:hypothetical protein
MPLPNPLVKQSRILIVLAFVIFCFSARASHVTGLTAFYRNGQAFLTWTNSAPASNYYKVYRSTTPIMHGTQLPACEYLGWTNQLSAKDFDMSKHYGTTSYLRIDSGGVPLASTKGLFVALTLADGSYYYAVTVYQNGVEDTSIITGVTSLTAPLSEYVSPPQPVFQQMLTVSGQPVEHWCNFISFKWDPSAPPILAAGFMASDFLLYRNHNTGNQPLCVQLHGGGSDLFAGIVTVSSNEMNLNFENEFPEQIIPATGELIAITTFIRKLPSFLPMA